MEITPARHPVVVLWTMLAAVVAVVMTVTGTIAILPDVGQDLGASQIELQWTVDINAVILAAFVLPCGSLLDRYGRRRGLVIGLIVLGSGATWSALAGSPDELLLSRVLTGIGAAIVFPGTLSTLSAVTPPDRKLRMIGMWSAAALVGGTIGVLASGAILAAGLGSGAFFLANAALAAACLAGTVWAVPETRENHAEPLDPIGAILSLVAIGALVLGIIQLPVDGLGAPVVVAGLAIGALATAAFIAWELRAEHPMLDVRLFRNHTFAGGVAGTIVLWMGAYGYLFMVFQYFPYVKGYDVMQAALCITPNGVSSIAAALVASRLSDRFGWARVTVAGLVVMGAATTVMMLVGTTRSVPLLCASFFLFGIGQGLAGTPATNAIIEGLPRAKQGVASAVNDASREVGAALGLALLGSAFNLGYRAELDGGVPGVPGALVVAARDSPAVGLGVADRAGAGSRRFLDTIADGAVAGWEFAFVAGTVVFLGGAVFLHLLTRERASADTPAATPRELETV